MYGEFISHSDTLETLESMAEANQEPLDELIADLHSEFGVRDEYVLSDLQAFFG